MLNKSSAGQNAGSPSTDLELVNYGTGWAWLRPELDAAIAAAEQLDQDLTRTLGWPESQPQPEERRVALTQRGRDLARRGRAVRQRGIGGMTTNGTLDQHTAAELAGIHDALRRLALVAQQEQAPQSSVQIEQAAKPGLPPRIEALTNECVCCFTAHLHLNMRKWKLSVIEVPMPDCLLFTFVNGNRKWPRGRALYKPIGFARTAHRVAHPQNDTLYCPLRLTKRVRRRW